MASSRLTSKSMAAADDQRGALRVRPDGVERPGAQCAPLPPRTARDAAGTAAGMRDGHVDVPTTVYTITPQFPKKKT